MGRFAEVFVYDGVCVRRERRKDDVLMSLQPLSAGETVRRLIAADSVAIIGASDDGSKASGRTLRYLLRYGFAGSIYPVNPHRGIVQGIPAFASVAELPETPELAVIVLPADAVEQAVKDCGAAGIRVAIVFASGFAEVGHEGMEAQTRLAEVARESGVRILGPNCVGAVGAASNLTAAFMTGLDQERFQLKDDGVAFVTQSGAMGAFILNMAQSTGLGVGRFLSTGNEADFSFSEALEGVVSDPSTRVVLGYVEGIRDPARFRAVLAEARRRRIPVVLMKVGRSSRGAAAAQSHTGALAGQDAVYDGLFAQEGVFRAETVDQLLDLGRILAAPKRPQGGRVAIVTLSGGAGVLLTDVAEKLGLEVPRWEDDWAERMAAVLPPFAAVRNPIDTTGVIAADQGVLHRAVDLCVQHPHTDVVVVMLGNMEREEHSVCETLARTAATTAKPIVVVWVGGSGRPQLLLSSGGVPTYPEPVRAMEAIAASVRWSEHAAPASSTTFTPPSASCSPEPSGAAHVGALDEVASKQLLADAGIPVVAERAVGGVQEAVSAADALGYPVVVKLLSSDVVHKSDLGMVHIGLADSESVAAAATAVLATAGRLGIKDRRIVVQRMIHSKTELILGMNDDPVFGPVVLLGLGGVLTEVESDVQLRLPPLTEADVQSMVQGLRSKAILAGARGRPAVDPSALSRVVLAFSSFVAETEGAYSSIDINPLLVDDSGELIAVDAVVVRAGDKS